MGSKRHRSKIILVCFLPLFFGQCISDSPFDAEQEFCSAVQKEEYLSLLPLTDRFLAQLSGNLSDVEKIEKLNDWLSQKTCIAHTEVFCVSCMFSLPPQSRIFVTLSNNGQSAHKVLDILMSDPPRVSRIFENNFQDN